MATWTDVVQYLTAKYSDAELNPEYPIVYLQFRMATGRRQSVAVAGRTLGDGTEWAQIESAIVPFNQLPPGRFQELLAAVGGRVCGGLSMTADTITLRHAVPLATLDAEELEAPLDFVTSGADALESQFSSGDQY